MWRTVAIFTLSFLYAIVFSYLLGSIPFGLLLTRMAGTEDIRRIGSGNIGATNVLRSGHKGIAFFTLLLDALKGYLAVTLVSDHAVTLADIKPSVLEPYHLVIVSACAIAAVAGHIFPFWLGFKGGKGVATFLGVQAAVSPPLAAFFILTWGAVFARWKISALAAVIATKVVMFSSLVFTDLPVIPAIWVIGFLVLYRHQENIRRMQRGEEYGVSPSPAPQSPPADDKEADHRENHHD